MWSRLELAFHSSLGIIIREGTSTRRLPMAKLGIRQRYYIIVPIFHRLFKEYPELAIVVRGILQKMVTHGHITEGARQVFLESIPIPLSPVTSDKEVTQKNKTRKVPIKK
ncbi:MAG: hypothetical protein NUV49_01245 [Patescibacteria group bacterium]|nr:hypothetical protein [Patescibacteria group bacterium]